MRFVKLLSQGGVLSALKSVAIQTESSFSCTCFSRQKSFPPSLWRHSCIVSTQSSVSKILIGPTKFYRQARASSTTTASSIFGQYNNSKRTVAQTNRLTGGKGIVVHAKMSHSSTDSGGELRDGYKGPKLCAMEAATNIFAHAVSSVLPHQMIEKNLNYDTSKSTLQVAGREYRLRHNVHVVGFGKAVLGMARALEDCIGEHIVDGILSIPLGSRQSLGKAGLRDMLLSSSSKIRVMEGAADNLPDEAAHLAAQEIARVVKSVRADDILVVLISGGGSALLPYPIPPLTVEDTLTVTRSLARAGVNILDLNMVRKQLELLKGGGIAKLAQPAKVVSLILSDIIGDDLGFIASGPTVPNTSTPRDCLDLFSRFHVAASIPAPVTSYLESKVSSGVETRQEDFSHVQNVLIGTNRIACNAACSKASSLGLVPYVLSTELSGEAKTVGVMFSVLAKYIVGVVKGLKESNSPRKTEAKLGSHINRMDVRTKLTRVRLMSEFGLSESSLVDIEKLVLLARMSKSTRGVCIVAGGETTVTVKGKGKGGRNQEMAVAAGLELYALFYGSNSQTDAAPSTRNYSEENVGAAETDDEITAQDLVFLSAGTDGQDGPTSAAGGWVDGDFLRQAKEADLNVVEYLGNNDSFTLLTKLEGGSNLVVTGLTGTNVMDLQILVVHVNRS